MLRGVGPEGAARMQAAMVLTTALRCARALVQSNVSIAWPAGTSAEDFFVFMVFVAQGRRCKLVVVVMVVLFVLAVLLVVLVFFLFFSFFDL